jgi:hypothetical protein
MPEVKTSKTSIQPDSLSKIIPLSMEEPSKVAHVGNSLDPQIGTHAHQIPLGK